MLKKTAIAALAAGSLLPLAQAQAADYAIDSEGQHAFIQFKISHLGYSYILGSFESFDGTFSYDGEDTASASAQLEVDVTSLTTNHAERDKHILSGDFLNADEYPTATFTSTGFESTGDGEGVLTGDLTLHGVTNTIEMPVTLLGEGEDPWGGYRAGFEGSTELALGDYDIDMSKFPEAMRSLELYVTFEGIRQ
ncbi:MULTISPECIES: YceI family protein [unclassified Halomonas]|uniref:YceI family protein n=1 Tax=unclassified Halomonas TaxID=2609666 RepID=UPI001C939B64|nr:MULTISPECIES: YceI family protein [unclassified Halomonas]MBY5926934.1 YceI family protein [Halomonas sp. DP4Y7-2]MBY5931065.1 YceI family protein [Halomonas sp. DP8Y7-3]MBY5984584.1 YceI family protein [Halomonas sp. DP5Y7-2]MBY6030527.1 YceI family protein [Halomonas sp. DP8Y7-1]MBY6233976.1 YceI family protein [Halomonas sp. DP4Y7-1]